ncbi:hypothetical protein [Desulfonatronovibrio magnus]|nr:hypothetical protein [Desulfonatronovibrio magnus]
MQSAKQIPRNMFNLERAMMPKIFILQPSAFNLQPSAFNLQSSA